MSGQLLDGRYRIIQFLGAGGFGKTYIAEDTKLYDAQCVVKQLQPTSTDPTTLQVTRRLFKSEAKILHQLGNHEQILRLLAYFEENQEFYLVQELIAGHDLSEELTPCKKLSESYVIALLQNLLETLAFVHQHHVIHRDIKPQNLIRRQQNGKIVLIDFGAVKQISTQVVNAQGQTRMTVSIGTPGYMPNEQASGSPKLSSIEDLLNGSTPNAIIRDHHSLQWKKQFLFLFPMRFWSSFSNSVSVARCVTANSEPLRLVLIQPKI
ncbi:MAG: serine/threonine protein kinase [Symploca sp. SIO1A3]|nr:serine/threonine protein kinase [Symploca sp. SIO1A3]